MAFFALSDPHGHFAAFEQAWARLNAVDAQAPVYVLGDVLDGGVDSGALLRRVYDLAQSGRMQFLLGNHETMFLDFLFGDDPLDWLTQDVGMQTTKSFFTEAQWQTLLEKMQAAPSLIRSLVKSGLFAAHGELFAWLGQQPRVIELPKQILVHAGIDEQAGALWRQVTPEAMLVEKFPPTTGHFLKPIIAGHVSTVQVSGRRRYLGHVYYDGASHYYLDGTTEKSGRVPVLYVDGGRYREV